MDNPRYSRQILLSEIGQDGQAKLSRSRVAVIGCGGLGSPVAAYLAGAGIGHLILIDGDQVDISNLHRQVFFTTENQGNKATLLGERLQTLNPDIRIESIPNHIDKSNIAQMLANANVVVECTDQWQTKMLVNDHCHLQGIPMIYGAVFKYEGYVSFFPNNSAKSIHLRDIFSGGDPQIPSCSEVGVFNTAVGIIALLQANETLKYILQLGDLLESRLLLYDALSATQRTIKLKKSFMADMPKVWESNDYSVETCDVPELTFTELQNRKDINIVSILEPGEHANISVNTIHIPLSKFHAKELATLKHDTTVFYCMAGKRSGELVAKLQKQFPHKLLYSLRGGLKAVISQSDTDQEDVSK